MGKRNTKLQFFARSFGLSLLIVFLAASSSQAYSHAKKTIEPGLYAEMEGGKKIYLTACATTELDVTDWAARVLANPEKYSKFKHGKCLKVPLAELTEEYQLEVMRGLFKRDSYDQAGWNHKITYTSSRRRGGETLWNISEWFTGDPRNYKDIQKHNWMSRRTRLYKNTKIKIPLRLLKPAFRNPILFEIAARRAAEGPSAESRRLNGDLTLKTDARGPYASYKVKKGDTIYSNVVMRFTDRVLARDVMDAAKNICRRSGIRDPGKLHPGDEIKIPLDLLSLMYLPPDDPRRQEYERIRREAAKYSNPVRTAELKGITVILDPGHGGHDPGALGKNRIYEDEVVYDIMCRIKRLLESTTMAEAIPMMVDKSQQYEPRDVSSFTMTKMNTC